jgi:hypothetical protein
LRDALDLRFRVQGENVFVHQGAMLYF